jgi:hypothetical protein
MSKRCWAVKLTWEPAARCDVERIFVRPGDNIEDTPEAVCEWAKISVHHMRANGAFYLPLTAEIEYEIDPDELPKPFTQRKTAPTPLAAPPKAINREIKEKE